MALLRLHRSNYAPHKPTTKQAAFLAYDEMGAQTPLEALYGGAAGGGKSDALLTGALLHVDKPGYSAILFRKTFQDLSLPGALLDRAQEWLLPQKVPYSHQNKTFTFPSGATLSFGYLDTENDKYRYQGAEFQFIGFDELTQFTESQYRYLLSRCRRLKDVEIPLRVRSASNPGGTGHQWVKERFVLSSRVFIAAGLIDNPHLDQEEYELALAELDPVTRAQLLHGDWDVSYADTFKPDMFNYRTKPIDGYTLFFVIDLAYTKKKTADYTAGGVVGVNAVGDIQWFYTHESRMDEAESIDWIFRTMAEWETQGVGAVHIECHSAYIHALKQEMRIRGKDFNVTPLKPEGVAKSDRILAVLPYLHRMYFREEDTWLANRFIEWSPELEGSVPDDAPDMVGYAVKLIKYNANQKAGWDKWKNPPTDPMKLKIWKQMKKGNRTTNRPEPIGF